MQRKKKFWKFSGPVFESTRGKFLNSKYFPFDGGSDATFLKILRFSARLKVFFLIFWGVSARKATEKPNSRRNGWFSKEMSLSFFFLIRKMNNCLSFLNLSLNWSCNLYLQKCIKNQNFSWIGFKNLFFSRQQSNTTI